MSQPLNPERAFPWARLLFAGALFAGVMIALPFLSSSPDGAPQASPVTIVVSGLVSGALFALLMGLWTLWTRRRR